MRTSFEGLVGDVGGTNARLALVDTQGHIRHPRSFPSRDYASLADVIALYGRTLEDGPTTEETADLVAFLKSLSGPLPEVETGRLPKSPSATGRGPG